MIGMNIGKMAGMSNLLFALSGMSAVAAVVLFFVLDIAKCWRMVQGRGHADRKMQRPDRTAVSNNAKTERLGRTAVPAWDAETVLPGREGQDATEYLDTQALEVIQDIVYMADMTEIQG